MVRRRAFTWPSWSRPGPRAPALLGLPWPAPSGWCRTT